MPEMDNITEDGNLVMSFKIHKQKKHGRTVLQEGEKSEVMTDVTNVSAPSGRIPRVSRLMALSIHLEKTLNDGTIRDAAEIARVSGLSRARISQILNLNLLSPRIQGEILFLPKIPNGHDPITERDIRSIALKPCWDVQLKDWHDLTHKNMQ
jgi:hypothetical protein